MRYGANDTVTVLNKTSSGYIKTVVTGVFWYRPKAVGIDGHGITNISNPVCIFPYETLSNYADTAGNGHFTFKKMDYIVLGRVTGDINSVKDINSYADVITIKNIDRNLKGSKRVQHIAVS